MKILIVSDTHRKHENYLKVLEKEAPLDMVIHCGDAEGAEYLIGEAAGCPLHIVLGNNDFFSDLPREIETEICGKKIWITHGHNYYISMGSEMLKQEAKSRGMDIVLYGHTHRPVVDVEEGLTAVNPGSLSYPRQEGRRPSYAVMEGGRRRKF
ncbi:MAG: metallophosphoesterase [Clostridiales bacterium]|nr:metallophosphoesterase [Clostridiales bacterium]